MNKSLLDALNWRYATKVFDPTKTISSNDLDTLLESIRLTPTSYGLQLMKTVIVEDATLRNDLVKHAYGQQQVKDASHLLVLCHEKRIDSNHIAAYISTISKTRNIEEVALQGFKNMMENSILNWSEKQQTAWMRNQVYIALGNLLTACAVLKVDACPMEGFNATAFDDVLNLDEKNLSSVLVVPIGYRSEHDKNAQLKKVRRSSNDFLITI